VQNQHRGVRALALGEVQHAVHPGAELGICTSASVGGYRLSEVTGSFATASVSHAGVWACTTATRQALRTAPRGTTALGYDIVTSLAHVSEGVWQTLRVCRPSRTLVTYVSYLLVRKTGSRPTQSLVCRKSALQCSKNALTLVAYSATVSTDALRSSPEHAMGKPMPLEDRLHAVEQLTKIFRIERLAYVGATALSFLLLFAVAIRMLIGGASLAQWALMLGSTGLITVTTAGMLRMWNQAIRLVASEPVDGRPE